MCGSCGGIVVAVLLEITCCSFAVFHPACFSLSALSVNIKRQIFEGFSVTQPRRWQLLMAVVYI